MARLRKGLPNEARLREIGGTFTADPQSTDTTNAIHVRWHYSANGTSGSWSGTASVVPDAIDNGGGGEV